MTKKKVLICVGLLLATALCVVLTRHGGQKANGLADQPGTSREIHGEPISASAVQESNFSAEISTNKQVKNRHPKPPSVQRRMVMAEFAPGDGQNPGGNNLPSGTAGTAADLARTNLKPVSSLPAAHQPFPGCMEMSFETLSGFEFALSKDLVAESATPAQTAAKAKEQIPQDIQSLDGKKVVIQGYLLPVRMDDGLAVEFLLMRNQSMCCYGVPPKINEWITVKMQEKGVKPVMDQPIAVVGTLHVSPILENGFLAGIYSMDGEKVIGPL